MRLSFPNTAAIPGPASCPTFFADDLALAERISPESVRPTVPEEEHDER